MDTERLAVLVEDVNRATARLDVCRDAVDRWNLLINLRQLFTEIERLLVYDLDR
jgi:hypothetical protein